MGDRDRKQHFRRGGGKGPDKGAKSGRRPAWRDRDTGPDGPVILYGWHTVAAALANPQRQIRKLLLTENAARRLADDNIDTRVTPEIVRPSLIDQRLGPDAVHQGLLAEADPCPRRISTPGAGKASCWCSTRSPIRTMSAPSCARRQPSRSRPLSPRRGTALGDRRAGEIGLRRSRLVPLVTVQNLARALTELNDRASCVGLAGQPGQRNARRGRLAAALALVLGAEGKGLRQLTRDTCSVVARLDMPGEIKA
jgi:23S rRNA (guanosine2251-2'-O)-methyltransferase